MKHFARILMLLAAAGTAATAQQMSTQIGMSYGAVAVPSFLPPALDPSDPAGYWTDALGLDTVQQASLKAILADQQSSAKSLRPSLEQARAALTSSAQADSAESELDRLSADLGTIFAQAVAAQAKAYARFYAMLTPDQKQKLAKISTPLAGSGFSVFSFSSAGPGTAVKQ